MAQTIDTAVTRTDAPRKVTGAAMFAGDEIPAGMLYAALTTSDIARGPSPRWTPRAPRPSRASSRSTRTRRWTTTKSSRASTPAARA